MRAEAVVLEMVTNWLPVNEPLGTAKIGATAGVGTTVTTLLLVRVTPKMVALAVTVAVPLATGVNRPLVETCPAEPLTDQAMVGCGDKAT